MKIISNEQKKSLFLRLIEECKKGRNIPSKEKGNAFFDAGRYDYGNGWKIKNNGILGLWYDGLDEKGKNIIRLICGGSIEEQDSAIIDKDCVLTRSFSDDELQEFLDRFFNMNNMEAINEFSGNNRFLQKNETYRMSYNTDNSLEYLLVLDYINELSGGIEMQNSEAVRFKGGDVLSADYISVEQDFPGFTICRKDQSGHEPIYISCMQEPGDLQYKLPESDENTKQILSIIQKVFLDVQSVYQSLRNGVYKRENFLPTKAFFCKQTPLQQREEELSSLEVEEKTISEAEALIDQQKKGQDLGEE